MTLDPTFPATVPVDAGATRAHRAQHTAELFDAAATTTDPQERTRLLEEVVVLNIPLADAVASRYRNRGIDLDDLTAVARLALVKASRRFDCGLGSDFADFATPTIRGEVRRYFRDFGWVVRPPRRIQEMQAAIAAAEGELNGRLGQSPRPSQLAEAMGADVADVEEALAARGCFSPTSLDLPVGERQDVSLADVLVDDASSFAAAEARAVLGPTPPAAQRARPPGAGPTVLEGTHAERDRGGHRGHPDAGVATDRTHPPRPPRRPRARRARATSSDDASRPHQGVTVEASPVAGAAAARDVHDRRRQARPARAHHRDRGGQHLRHVVCGPELVSSR